MMVFTRSQPYVDLGFQIAGFEMNVPLHGTMRQILRGEALGVLIASLLAYQQYGTGWTFFLATLLIPDASLLFYFRNARLGALMYNIAHSYIGPLTLLVISLYGSHYSQWLCSMALVWLAHIGMDRMLGFGLKYESGFHFTHLGTLAKKRVSSSHPD